MSEGPRAARVVGDETLRLERKAVVGRPGGPVLRPTAAESSLPASFLVESAGGRLADRGERASDVGLDPDLDDVVGIHLCREATEVDDLFVPGGVDPHRVELLKFVADAHDDVRIVEPGN